jgi:glycosyltransferase involved in cell wall biosynthesis
MTTIPRVIHFVTGGGSGATKVALDVACGHLRSGNYAPLLVLRRKKAPLPASMQAQITQAGLQTAWVESGFKTKTLRQLAAIIADFKPAIFVAHGNSEHLWGRQAAIAAAVPVVVHVEHNRERYPFWRIWSAKKLAPKTSATVCVSHGVADHVAARDIGSARTVVIHNGVDVVRFAKNAPSFSERAQDVVMMARFARQKDHATLLRATPHLIAAGWTGRLLLAGAGSSSHQKKSRKLAAALGISDRVDFLGQVSNNVAIYQRCRVAVLSTHYEGLPLALVESMAAGCGVIGSAVCGVTDIIEDGKNGWLFPCGDDRALAKIIKNVLAGGTEVERIVTHGRDDAPKRFSLEKQLTAYETLFAELSRADAR